MTQSIAGSARPLLPARETGDRGEHLPIIVALLVVALGGALLLNRAALQARDTIRKHHLEDIEQALYTARNKHGTYPPYAAATWCGELSAPGNEAVRAQVEEALRAQNKQYANAAKPFPRDPLPAHDYFYWKRSPAVFELYSILEADPTGERATLRCPTASDHPAYDYGLTSLWRE